MLLIRYILIMLVVYLLVRVIIKSLDANESSRYDNEPGKKGPVTGKKVSKEVGEYIDYEEIDKKLSD